MLSLAKDEEGIQLIVDLNSAKDEKDVEKGKWKQKSIEDILGIPILKKRGGRKKQNCVMYRSVVAAAALPI